MTKKGADQSPVYKYPRVDRQSAGVELQQYIVGKDGKVFAFFPSNVTPEDPALRDAIAKALARP